MQEVPIIEGPYIIEGYLYNYVHTIAKLITCTWYYIIPQISFSDPLRCQKKSPCKKNIHPKDDSIIRTLNRSQNTFLQKTQRSEK